jgi:hypothetical protein
MNANQRVVGVLQKLVVAGAALSAIAFTAQAQVQSTTKMEHGAAEQSVKVERGEVVYVSGNDLVVKMEDGEIRHFPNVPETHYRHVDDAKNGHYRQDRDRKGVSCQSPKFRHPDDGKR